MKPFLTTMLTMVLVLLPTPKPATFDLSHSISPIEAKWTDDKGPEDSTICSAGYLGSNLWLTAGHCFSPDSDDQTDFKFFINKKPMSLIMLAPDEDIAVVAAEPPKGMVPLHLAPNDLKKGEEVFAEGFPGGSYDSFFVSGRVMNLAFHIEERTYVVTSMIVAPGMSGSPVVNAEGKVVGVLQAGWGTAQWKSISGITPRAYLNLVNELFH